MKTLHFVTALIELGAGAAMMSFPSESAVLLVGAPLGSEAASTMARIGGAGLLTLGVACWLARDDAESRASKGLVAAILLYDVAACVLIAFAGIGFGLNGVALWPAVILHAIMSAWCVACLRQNRRNVTIRNRLEIQSQVEGVSRQPPV